MGNQRLLVLLPVVAAAASAAVGGVVALAGGFWSGSREVRRSRAALPRPTGDG